MKVDYTDPYRYGEHLYVSQYHIAKFRTFCSRFEKTLLKRKDWCPTDESHPTRWIGEDVSVEQVRKLFIGYLLVDSAYYFFDITTERKWTLNEKSAIDLRFPAVRKSRKQDVAIRDFFELLETLDQSLIPQTRAEARKAIGSWTKKIVAYLPRGDK